MSIISSGPTPLTQATASETFKVDDEPARAPQPPPCVPPPHPAQPALQAPFVVRSAVWYRHRPEPHQPLHDSFSIYARPGGCATLVLSDEASLNVAHLTLADLPGTSTRIFIDLDPDTLRAVPQRFAYKSVEMEASTLMGSAESTLSRTSTVRSLRNWFKKEQWSWSGQSKDTYGLRLASIAGDLQIVRAAVVDAMNLDPKSSEISGHFRGYAPKKSGPNLAVQKKLAAPFRAPYLGTLGAPVWAELHDLEMMLHSIEMTGEAPLLSADQRAQCVHYLPYLPRDLHLTRVLTQPLVQAEQASRLLQWLSASEQAGQSQRSRGLPGAV